MKIFILGISKTGKSTLSKKLEEKYGFLHIQSSIMIRKTFNKQEKDFKNRQDFINAITDYSIKLNQKNPYVLTDYIKSNYDLNDDVIIEGIRNPNNFFELFNIREDKVVFLDRKTKDIQKTGFEEGLKIIIDYLKWNIKQGIYKEQNFQELIYKEYEEIKGLLNEKSLFN